MQKICVNWTLLTCLNKHVLHTFCPKLTHLFQEIICSRMHGEIHRCQMNSIFKNKFVFQVKKKIATNLWIFPTTTTNTATTPPPTHIMRKPVVSRPKNPSHLFSKLFILIPSCSLSIQKLI